MQPVDEPRLRLPAPGGILAGAPARQCAPAMSGGWDANGEYVPLGAWWDASDTVKFPEPGTSPMCPEIVLERPNL